MPVRRVHFAAPVILVIGCSAPPRELPPNATTVSDEELASIEPDAAVPPDAAPERRRSACASGTTVLGKHCNPPRTRRPPPDAGPPPAVRNVSVINWSRDGDETRIIINRGTDSGFHDGDRGELYDADRATVPGSDFVLEGCTARSCRAAVDLSLEEVREAAGARLL